MAETGPLGGRLLVMYYRTHHDGGRYRSPLALTARHTGLTDLVVGTVRLDTGGVVSLNSALPGAPGPAPMWVDLAALREQGVRVLALLGGRRSFARLDHGFRTNYPPLKAFLRHYRLDGLDLRVPEPMSAGVTERLVDRLRADFGADFVISFAPTAAELSGGGTPSALYYDRLYWSRGDEVDRFHVRMNGGGRDRTAAYERIVARGVIPPGKLVFSAPTSLSGSDDETLAGDELKTAVAGLLRRCPGFGGVAGWAYWEYVDALADPTDEPWRWAQEMGAVLGLGAGRARWR
ncbi:chitinase [Streptomyces sp. NBC_00648]|uniref:chitinase n=1 Tax=Streptomyces sp. NBC_00648 TaxID=2975797 RepID=UPI00324EFF92